MNMAIITTRTQSIIITVTTGKAATTITTIITVTLTTLTFTTLAFTTLTFTTTDWARPAPMPPAWTRRAW